MHILFKICQTKHENNKKAVHATELKKNEND